MKSSDNFLDPKIRAEDILLGSLGYGEEVRIVSVSRIPNGYKGIARWPEGDEFSFEYNDTLDTQQEWALAVLVG